MPDSELNAAPCIILVEPQMGENIGMVARAMANFGLSDLRLVKPRDGWPSETARATSANASHVIDQARVFETLDEAIADLNHVLATTARQRDNFKPVHSPVSAMAELRPRAAAGQQIGIMFGRERYGLSNEEVARADAIVTFPVDPEFASLNIAQAVLLMSYEWIKSGQEDPAKPRFAFDAGEPAPRHQVEGLINHLESALAARGYFRPISKKPTMLDNLRAVFTRPAFTEAEIKVLRGVLSSLDYFSPNEPRGAGYPPRKQNADEQAMQRPAGGSKGSDV